MNFNLLSLLDDYLHAMPAIDRDVVEAGPFRCYLHRESNFPFFSYARPVSPLSGDLQAGIAAVRQAFHDRGRVCRWEWVDEVAPELAPALSTAKFPIPMLNPLMAMEPERLRLDEECVADLTFEEDPGALAEMAQVQRQAFGIEPADLQDEDVGELLRLVKRGARVVVARVDGTIMGGGLHIPLGEASELAGIGVHPEHQGRGIGGSITGALALDAFQRGCRVPFLTAGDETIARVYARVGFRLVGTGLATMDAPQL